MYSEEFLTYLVVKLLEYVLRVDMTLYGGVMV
jgi:hypothetical protein